MTIDWKPFKVNILCLFIALVDHGIELIETKYVYYQFFFLWIECAGSVSGNSSRADTIGWFYAGLLIGILGY